MSEEILNEDVIPTPVSKSETVVEVEDVVEAPAVEEAPVAKVEAKVVDEPKPTNKVPAAEEKTIVINEEKDTVKGLAPVENGAIGSTVLKKPKKEVKPEPKTANAVEKVAIRSSKNVVWQGVGKVVKGINIVTKDQAAQWMTRNHIELVAPEDVAKEFGN